MLQTSLDKALTRQIPVCEKIAYGYRKQAHAAAEEWWLCSNDTGEACVDVRLHHYSV